VERIVGAIEAVNGAGDEPALYERLEQALGERPGHRLTYLSVAPSLFAGIAERLAGIGLGRGAGAASRVVVEKPFGEDLASSRELRAALHEHFDEDQLLRIDHYLGKEAAQNLLVLRFVNGIFEPLWDRRSIESVQITVAEDGGVDGRGDFYDANGALRDVGQNHLLQLLALTLMDAPTRMAGRGPAVRAAEGAALDRPRAAGRRRVRQYEGYTDEEGVDAGSRTETYAAMRVEVRSWRWADVPCYLRTGKRLTAKQAEIAVAFRPSPHIPFEDTDGWAGSNRLIIGIQPGERVQLHVTGKRPGSGSSSSRSRSTSTPARQRRPTRPRPTSGCSATRSTATPRCSPPAPRSRASGPPSNRCCASAPTPSPTHPARPGPRRPTSCSPATAGGGAPLASSTAPLLRLRRAARRRGDRCGRCATRRCSSCCSRR
jgi:glucose-6-phosphate 1-dehydrogenase